AMLVAVAVLIITCPCALGLAVPVVQVVAAGELFRRGIVVKDGSALERLADADIVAFDKTGTLTMGRPRLVRIDSIAGNRAIVCAMAAHSRHPLSQGLVRDIDISYPFAFDRVTEIAGGGLEAWQGADFYRLGNRAFACGTGLTPAGDTPFSEVVLSKNGVDLARFLFDDTL
ncbi:nitrogen fixation protein FixI, partial [Rhizobium sp. L9]